MFRKLFGFAIFALIAIFALKVVFGLLGLAFGLLVTVLWFAAIGFVFYMMLKLVAPGAAASVREMIIGKPAV